MISLYDDIQVGLSARDIEFDEQIPAYSRVIVTNPMGDSYTAGDNTGQTLYAESIYASQTAAERILEGIQGFKYRGYTASSAIYQPCAEIGDGVYLADQYVGLYSESENLGKLHAVDISSPKIDDSAYTAR